ncbi:hypothetical protein DPEC_G00335740 [Dallia pectoralis]|uniref:Uncharacterized protein n=1 Tax=Dallia pectoralis TaxID=75939 RepID=A0ACC2F731_DALPE|nr:hypothetical protein DPEC_G00335740 [Dallia pectoralis]
MTSMQSISEPSCHACCLLAQNMAPSQPENRMAPAPQVSKRVQYMRDGLWTETIWGLPSSIPDETRGVSLSLVTGAQRPISHAGDGGQD